MVMNSVRSSKSYYAAAFILGALIALLVAAPANSAETLHGDASKAHTFEAQPAAPSKPDDTNQIYGALQ